MKKKIENLDAKPKDNKRTDCTRRMSAVLSSCSFLIYAVGSVGDRQYSAFLQLVRFTFVPSIVRTNAGTTAKIMERLNIVFSKAHKFYSRVWARALCTTMFTHKHTNTHTNTYRLRQAQFFAERSQKENKSHLSTQNRAPSLTIRWKPIFFHCR